MTKNETLEILRNENLRESFVSFLDLFLKKRVPFYPPKSLKINFNRRQYEN